MKANEKVFGVAAVESSNTRLLERIKHLWVKLKNKNQIADYFIIFSKDLLLLLLIINSIYAETLR